MFNNELWFWFSWENDHGRLRPAFCFALVTTTAPPAEWADALPLGLWRQKKTKRFIK